MPIPLTCPKCGHSWDYTPREPNLHRRYAHCPVCGHNCKLPRQFDLAHDPIPGTVEVPGKSFQVDRKTITILGDEKR